MQNGAFFTRNALFIHFPYEYRTFLIHSIVRQKYSFREFIHSIQGWWVPLHGVQRPISLEYQICTSTIPFDTLVTGMVGAAKNMYHHGYVGGRTRVTMKQLKR